MSISGRRHQDLSVVHHPAHFSGNSPPRPSHMVRHVRASENHGCCSERQIRTVPMATANPAGLLAVMHLASLSMYMSMYANCAKHLPLVPWCMSKHAFEFTPPHTGTDATRLNCVARQCNWNSPGIILG